MNDAGCRTKVRPDHDDTSRRYADRLARSRRMERFVLGTAVSRCLHKTLAMRRCGNALPGYVVALNPTHYVGSRIRLRARMLHKLRGRPLGGWFGRLRALQKTFS